MQYLVSIIYSNGFLSIIIIACKQKFRKIKCINAYIDILILNTKKQHSSYMIVDYILGKQT